jgi:hypothetical protein
MTKAMFCAVLASIVIPANCYATSVVAVVKTISTGFDESTLTKLPNNAPDLDFIVGPGSAAHVGQIPIARSTPLPPPYFGDAASANSRWIGINTGIGEEGLNVIVGTFFLDTQVDLSGFDATTAKIAGLLFGADNKMEGVTINATTVWTRPISFGADFFNWTSIGDVGLGSFAPGLNTIRFHVLNDGDAPTALALRLEGAVVAVPVPEPARLTLTAAALGSWMLHRRRAAHAAKT